MDFIKELIGFIKAQKKLWLVPLILVFGIISLLLFVSQGSVVAPFIYTLF